MSAAEMLAGAAPGRAPDWHSLEGKKVGHGPSAPGTYREGRCQSGRVPRGAFVKA